MPWLSFSPPFKNVSQARCPHTDRSYPRGGERAGNRAEEAVISSCDLGGAGDRLTGAHKVTARESQKKTCFLMGSGASVLSSVGVANGLG